MAAARDPVAALGWLARGEHEIPGDHRWLAPGEVRRASAMRFTKRRTEYLLRRWVGKQAIAATGALGHVSDARELARVEVANRLGGAPYVLLDGRPIGLDVSLTDRAGWAVCVVGSDLARVGCDLEVVEPRSPGFVADYLTEAERCYVATQPDADARDAAANLLWSAKESALKVLRTGLRRDTRSVEVAAPRDVPPRGATGWAPLRVTTAEGTALPGWWRRDGDFLLTVAADRPVPQPVALPGSADLADARPVHSWVGRPLAPELPADPPQRP